MNIAHIMTIALLCIGLIVIIALGIKTAMIYREIDVLQKEFRRKQEELEEKRRNMTQAKKVAEIKERWVKNDLD